MFSRPLVPALCATIIGILIGHTLLTNVNLSVLFFPIVIAVFLGMTFILPAKVRTVWLMGIFLLIGVNSQVNKHTLPGLPQTLSEGERVVVEGTVYNLPKVRVNVASLYVHAEKIFLAREVRSVQINILVRIYRYRGTLNVGERIRFPAKLKEFKNFNNPGGFDYRSYMQTRGLSFMAIVSDGRYVVPMGEGDLGIVGNVLEKIRRPLRNLLTERLSYGTSPIYAALILGERQGLTPELRKPFDRSGVGHIMAVSGLHLGLVAWLFYAILRWVLSFSYRLTLMTDIRKVAAILTTVPVITYGVITGLQVSTQRAMIMVLVFLWSVIMGKEKDVWSSLCLAALIILALMGNSLFTVSFQLSFTAVAGILWLAPLILSRIQSVKLGTELFARNHVLRTMVAYLVGLIAVTTAAAVVTIPLIAFHFHRFPLVGLAANITVVPIIGLWVIPLGLVSCIALPFSSTLAGFFLSLGVSGLNLAVPLVKLWSDIPWASLWVIRPNWLEILLLYGLLFLGLNFFRARVYRILLLVVVILLCTDTGYWIYHTHFDSNLRVTILDAGRGDVAFIQFPGHERMLIARNAFGHGGFNLGQGVIAPCLWQGKIQRIDYLFLASPYGQQTDRVQFMINTFHPQEVLSSLPTERTIGGCQIKGDMDEGITLFCRGWSFNFCGREVQIGKGNWEGGKKEFTYIIARGNVTRLAPVHVFDLSRTGAITITVDSKARLNLKGFLKKNLL
ncbi:MAG: ComEC/Rec2 family competence protein [Deltaproteobacteria bacterium]|nr:ComEC/Rec2 family competence protein [Deltaproteobacteria bacterium]MBW2340112.1 ComEC/Rec2 family competence protein [Deltaproteobacteria bacterium]